VLVEEERREDEGAEDARISLSILSVLGESERLCESDEWIGEEEEGELVDEGK